MDEEDMMEERMQKENDEVVPLEQFAVALPC